MHKAHEVMETGAVLRLEIGRAGIHHVQRQDMSGDAAQERQGWCVRRGRPAVDFELQKFRYLASEDTPSESVHSDKLILLKNLHGAAGVHESGDAVFTADGSHVPCERTGFGNDGAGPLHGNSGIGGGVGQDHDPPFGKVREIGVRIHVHHLAAGYSFGRDIAP